MIRLIILIFIIFFYACSPTSNKEIKNFLIPLVQGNGIGPIAIHENLDSLDSEEIPFRENLVNFEWALLYGDHLKLTKDSQLAVDGNGFIYIAADTDGNPFYDSSVNRLIIGKNLVFGKYDSQKNEIWTHQLGNPYVNFDVTGIAVDTKGNAYITGSIIKNSFEESRIEKKQLLFVIKVNPEGDLEWIRETGSTNDAYKINPGKITVDTLGNSYIVGTSNGPFEGDNIKPENGFITKFDTHGNQIWVKELPGSEAKMTPTSVAFDKRSGNVYLCGSVNNNNIRNDKNSGIGRNDLLIFKYDENGNGQLFARLGFALGSVFGYTITTDALGNILVGAETDVDFASKTIQDNSHNGLIIKYDSSGMQKWIRQFGPSTPLKSTFISEITTDRVGNVFTTGSTNGFIKFNDGPSEGNKDVFVTKHSPSGEVLKLWQWGNQQQTMIGSGIGIDLNGNLYTTGWTDGELFGNPNIGTIDVFLIKFQ
ncbi:beta-propeller repeat protein [Leptospira kirschneri str. 2008720114]|uniref:SBBP repeat beta-propeller lipoprotein, LipL53 family n=1 Tax=Leptospira kirschneri TaxID=29507 RepID=UPI0002881BA0|nr:SBBP repeat-containing protein [Leptospira kirschneri]EKP03753.1 beta-propeller repeat protein [Leptospira kirschneri str. 2008720114]EMK18228.1 beta-propeller repeat protein [Leptospira kirschneri serovar Bim str. PUO 1247]EMN05586.1 beta-propeller repeat protein [Leptospira kirschneri serovar Bim str. 1051]